MMCYMCVWQNVAIHVTGRGVLVSEGLIVMQKKTFIKFKPHAWNLNLTPTTLYAAKPIRILGVDLCLRGDKTASHIDAPGVTLLCVSKRVGVWWWWWWCTANTVRCGLTCHF